MEGVGGGKQHKLLVRVLGSINCLKERMEFLQSWKLGVWYRIYSTDSYELWIFTLFSPIIPLTGSKTK
jgi:hypothetical protein